jgi:hypothetical protein
MRVPRPLGSRKLDALFWSVWALAGVLSLAGTVAGLYVAYHFIVKYW